MIGLTKEDQLQLEANAKQVEKELRQLEEARRKIGNRYNIFEEIAKFFTKKNHIQWYDVFTGMHNNKATLGDIQKAAFDWKYDYYLFNGYVYPSEKQGTVDPLKDSVCRLEDIGK